MLNGVFRNAKTISKLWEDLSGHRKPFYMVAYSHAAELFFARSSLHPMPPISTDFIGNFAKDELLTTNNQPEYIFRYLKIKISEHTPTLNGIAAFLRRSQRASPRSPPIDANGLACQVRGSSNWTKCWIRIPFPSTGESTQY